MKEQTRKVLGYLDLLGVKIDSDRFDSRIKAQKLTYIIQKIIGKQLYDDFDFYIRGPYSRELARDYFGNKEEFVKGKSDYKPTKEEYREIERVKPLLDTLNQTDLEIVASLLFLEKDRGFDENNAEIELNSRKPHLKQEDIWRGTNTIKKLLLTEKLRETIMDSLKSEIEEWDSISNESLGRFGQ